ncbi:hypothetical protein [Halobaculum lipolyticum]|uniref:Uncharacterized protein n=1 Tax=Halobaculum lipolyticum TaxID=3032001 RepID=A0ABD5WAE2_9EURY|nr:hypothetical protein [Halobaculum sp. DT31]
MSLATVDRVRRTASSSAGTVPVVVVVLSVLDGLALAYNEHTQYLLSNWFDLSVVEWIGFTVLPFAVAPVGLFAAVYLLRTRWNPPGSPTTVLPAVVAAVAVGQSVGQHLGMRTFAGAAPLPATAASVRGGLTPLSFTVAEWLAFVEPVAYDTVVVVAAVAVADARRE